jgi:hypothetical protein
METVLPSKAKAMGAYASKPLPLSAAALPTGPVLGLRLMPGLTVYPVEAAFALSSDAVTAWVPATAAGMVNTQ